MNNYKKCLKHTFLYISDAPIFLIAVSLVSGILILRGVNCVLVGFNQNIDSDKLIGYGSAIITAAGVLFSISIGALYERNQEVKKQKGMLKALALSLTKIFETSESYKDAFIYANKNCFKDTQLKRYLSVKDKAEVQKMMANDLSLTKDFRELLRNPPEGILGRITGLPHFPLSNINTEQYVRSIDFNFQGMETSLLKFKLWEIHEKIELCNRYVLDTSLPHGRLLSLLESVVDLDKIIQEVANILCEFRCIRKYEGILNEQGHYWDRLSERIIQ